MSTSCLHGGAHRLLVVILTASVPLLVPFDLEASSPESDPYVEINDSWERFGAVYGRVVENYYQDVDHEEIMRAAIDGLLRDLDAYSQYFDAEGLQKLRQDTTGKFAGLGITVGIKDHFPVIIAPIEGTPAARAGLLPGDLIVAIEGHNTYNLGLEEIVTRLRGEPGSRVRITMSRQGVREDWDVDITREIITMRSVAVAAMISPGVGYLSMRQTQFSEDTSQEVADALQRLHEDGLQALILDLRGNPGGLLSQATEVADLFLPKGAPIVSVRERHSDRGDTRLSKQPPLAGDIRLAVLIDGGSASAAEIVAGALQDNDRALIVGTASFGKGSVQTIFDLHDREQAALKLTTALYYTPSGRSIHRESLTVPPGILLQVPAGEFDLPAGVLLGLILRAPDTETAIERLQARFDLEAAEARQVLATSLEAFVGEARDRDLTRSSALPDSSVYHTRRGRKVFGRGGITPDVTVPATPLPAMVQQVARQRAFFDFIVDYVGADSTGRADSLQVDDAMLEAFRQFLPLSSLARAQDRDATQELEHLRRLATEGGWNGSVLRALDSLEVAMQRREEFVAFPAGTLPYIKAGLQRELELRLHGRRASLLSALRSDNQVQAALELLNDEDRYRSLLRPSTASANR